MALVTGVKLKVTVDNGAKVTVDTGFKVTDILSTNV